MKTKRIPFDLERVKAGAKVVTRCDYPVEIRRCNANGEYPIRAILKTEDGCFTHSFTVEGRFIADEEESDYDLFIEEEETEEVEETDDYNPYKETVKSIADMVERYTDADSDLKDFYNQVRVRCREAVEYEKKWIKNQGEQESFNTVKPKFKVGDWIVQENVGIYKVTEICESWYEVIDSNESNYSIFFDQEPMCHLWSIEDAKPGDILATKNGYNILIFKNIKSSSGSGFSSYYNYNNFSDYSNLKEGSWNRDCFQPATKKHRDLLFQKMKEAGYEWNSDKKELHKIEEVKKRRMTYQELSWWLREHPEEHREMTYSDEDNYVSSNISYLKSEAKIQVNKKIVIRKNGGEWQEPLIEL